MIRKVEEAFEAVTVKPIRCWQSFQPVSPEKKTLLQKYSPALSSMPPEITSRMSPS